MLLDFVNFEHLIWGQFELGLFLVASNNVVDQKSFFLHLANDMIFDASKLLSSSVVVYEFQDCLHH